MEIKDESFYLAIELKKVEEMLPNMPQLIKSVTYSRNQSGGFHLSLQIDPGEDPTKILDVKEFANIL